MELLIFAGLLAGGYLLESLFQGFGPDAATASGDDGTSGDDDLSGDGTDNTLHGQGGNDIISGFGGADLLDGGTGADHVIGGAGNDILFGRQGADTLDGGFGDDKVFGGWGYDQMAGGAGDDVLVGGAGVDMLTGGDGGDLLIGGGTQAATSFFADGTGAYEFTDLVDHQADTLTAGAGIDALILDRSDTGTGGADGDLFFVLDSADQTGAAAITDFNQAEDALVIDYKTADFAVPPTVTVVDFTDGTGADVLVNGIVVAKVTGAQGMSSGAVVLESLV